MINSIAVIGANGYIASVLCPVLKQHGYNIIQIDSPKFADENNTTYQIDLLKTNADEMHDFLESCDFCIYTAAINGQPEVEKFPEESDILSVKLPRIISEILPTLFFGAESTYGTAGGKIIKDKITEEDNPIPLVQYAKDKHAGETAVLKNSGTVIRLATVFGPSPKIRTNNLVHDWMITLANGNKLEVYQPSVSRNLLYINVLINVILKILELPWSKLEGEVFNIASAYIEKQLLATRLGVNINHNLNRGPKISIVPGKDSENRQFELDTSKISKIMGYPLRLQSILDLDDQINTTVNCLVRKGHIKI